MEDEKRGPRVRRPPSQRCLPGAGGKENPGRRLCGFELRTRYLIIHGAF